MTEPIYSGEAILMNWNDAKSGRKIVLRLEKYAPGAHPFDGMDGERFAVVIMGPLANAEHGQEVSPGRGKAAGAVRLERPSNPLAAEGNISTPPAAHSLPPVVGVEPGGDSVPSIAAPPGKQRTASQRAALLLQNADFDEFARSSYLSFADFETTESWLLGVCGVERKREITEDNAAFKKIEGNFQAWRLARAHGQLAR